GLATKFEGIMKTKGATINQLPEDTRREWANKIPNVAGDWIAFNAKKGLPAKEVMTVYLTKMKAAGAKPLRDWTA
ncbi:MAG: hypothetical protein AAF942_18520, partial [Pseudomonadota bacterium]